MNVLGEKDMNKYCKIIIATLLAASASCACAQRTPSSSGIANTTNIDNKIENAETVADNSGYVYTGVAPITEDDGTIKIMAEKSNYKNVDISKAPIVLKVFEEAGVTSDWQLYEYDSYADETDPIIMSSDTDADIIKVPGLDPNQVYIKTGLFVPLDEYFDYMPNFIKWLSENPVEKAELTAEDGHIYYVPSLNLADDYQPCLMYNQVWLKASGLSEPETLDEFVELLRYFRDNDMNGDGSTDDEIPMSIMAEFLPYMFGPAFGLDLVSGFQADDNGVVTYAYADSDNYRKYLTFLNSLYEEGLLEADYTSLDRDTVIDRISKDLTGVAFDFSWAMSMMYSNVLPYYDGTVDTAFLGAKPLSGEHDGFYVGRNSLAGMFGVNTNSVHIELAVKFLDYAMCDHCQDYYQWGFEGESYIINDDGEREYTGNGKNNDWLQSLGINPGFVLPAAQSVEATDILVADWHAESNLAMREYVRDPWPAIYSTSKESDTVNLYMPDIQSKVDESAAGFINGSLDIETTFDAYITELMDLHLSEVIEVKQTQYNRYIEAL